MASDEELRAMGINRENNANKDVATKQNSNNKMASILRVIAIIEIVCGFILGGILGDTFEIGYDYN